MSLLNTSTSALLAFQRAMDTVSHNVANAGVAGYSRQRTELATNPANNYGSGFVGAGVHVAAITRSVDQFQTGRALDSTSELSRLEQLATLSARIDTSFSDSGTSLGTPWSGFFDAVQGVATMPAANASRQTLLRNAETLAARFRALDGVVSGLQREVAGRIGNTVERASRLTAEIASLNAEIGRQRGLAGGQPPNDLLDQRERLVSELGGLVGVTTALQDDGALNVFMEGGTALVVGNTAMALTTTADEFRPDRVGIALVANGVVTRLGESATGGALRGLLEFRSDVLDPASRELGRVAATLVTQVNEVHHTGMDQYGDLGGDFFAPISPAVLAGRNNTGSGALSATLADPAALVGADLEFSFDGVVWSVTDRATGFPASLSGSGTPASPFRVDGIDVVVSGAPAAGDRFLLQPAAGAATRVRLAVSDPARIAAASPLAATAALTNTGAASVSAIDVDDVSAAGFASPSTIVFTSPTSYTRDAAGPFAYSEATGIAGAGWTLRLSGPPSAGDTFQVALRGPGSSDNGNARLFAALDDVAVLDGGTTSLNGAVAQVTVQAGFSARQYGDAHDAQRIVSEQITAEREATSGVNLDEEAAQLMKYQQAYQAAAQMIATADSLFDSLLAAVRR